MFFPMAALALEFTEKDKGLSGVVTNADRSGVRSKILSDLAWDGLFIAFYLLLYVGIALVMAQRGGAWRYVAVVAAACAMGAAASDGAENLAMARLVERQAAAGAPAPPAAQAAAPDAPTVAGPNALDVKTPGLRKWVLSFATLALLSLTFWGHDSKWAWAAFGLCLFIALLGFVGLLVLRGNPKELRPVQLAFVLTLLLLPLVGFVLRFRWELFTPAARR